MAFINYANEEIKGTLTTTGALTSGGSITIPDYIIHAGDGDTKIGFNTDNSAEIRVGGNLQINADASRSYLRYQGSSKLYTDSTGVNITGGATTTASSTFAGANVTADFAWSDSVKANFGASNDLQIYHDGSNSYIKDTGTGVLYIQGSGNVQIEGANGENMIICNENGSVQLHYDNVQKFQTTSTGVAVSGNIVLDDGSGASPNIQFINENDDDWYIYNDANGKFQVQQNSTIRATFSSGDLELTNDLVVSGGGISLLGTGRIQGIDTVSSGTDAANKTYVDNAVSTGVGSYLPLAGGTMTGALNLSYSGSGGQVGIDIHNTGTNTADDAKITFETQGQLDWIAGIDRSATAFKISRSAAFGTNDVLTLDNSSNATFAGNLNVEGADVTITANVIHAGDSNTYFGFHNNDEWRVVTGGTERLEVSNSGIKLSSSGSTVNTILDEDNMASNSATALATQQSIKAYVDSSTTGVLTYQGTWNASTNSPTLSSGSGTPGYYYIVSHAGSTNLDGITDWAVGDWAVFSDQATDAWQKIDNTAVGNVSGSGTIERLAKWSGSGTLANSIITDDGSGVSVAGTLTVTGADAITIPDYILHSGDNSKFGFPSNDNFKVRLGGSDVFTMSTTAATFTGDFTVGDELTITTIGNATADPDKFLCASGSNKVGYRTGAQVLSDIGAAPATGGAYLPLAGGTMTGNVIFNDSVKALFGTGDDLQMQHTGSTGIIDN